MKGVGGKGIGAKEQQAAVMTEQKCLREKGLLGEDNFQQLLDMTFTVACSLSFEVGETTDNFNTHHAT